MNEMPEKCNALLRHDDLKEFCKVNCFWGIRNRRSRIGKTKYDSPRISLTINQDTFDFICRQALHKSLELGKTITFNDMVREILYEKFPVSKQLDLWGK